MPYTLDVFLKLLCSCGLEIPLTVVSMIFIDQSKPGLEEYLIDNCYFLFIESHILQGVPKKVSIKNF